MSQYADVHLGHNVGFVGVRGYHLWSHLRHVTLKIHLFFMDGMIHKVRSHVNLTTMVGLCIVHLMNDTERREAEAWHRATLEIMKSTVGKTYDEWKSDPDVCRDQRIHEKLAKWDLG